MLERPLSYNGITINDETQADFHNGYWIRVTSVDGLFGDEIRYESHPIPSGTGERSSYAFRSGKQLVLTGEIWGKGISQLREGQWILQSMFWDLQPHKLYFTPWPLVASGDSLYITCRCNQPLVMADEFTKLDGLVQLWTVGLRADNPRSFKTSNNSTYPVWQT